MSGGSDNENQKAISCDEIAFTFVVKTDGLLKRK